MSFLASIVFADETTQVSKVLYKLKWFTIYGNRCGWCGVDSHHLCLGCIDGKPSLLCISLLSIIFFMQMVMFY